MKPHSFEANYRLIDPGKEYPSPEPVMAGIVTWGNSEFGSIGRGGACDDPQADLPPGVIVALDATNPPMAVQGNGDGNGHGLALFQGGQLYAWGSNFSYEATGAAPLGECIPSPTLVALSGVAKVRGGAFCTFAILGDGSVYAWGTNYQYGLALEERLDYTVSPCQSAFGADLGGVEDIATMGDAAIFRMSSGELLRVGAVWNDGNPSLGHWKYPVAVDIDATAGGGTMDGVADIYGDAGCGARNAFWIRRDDGSMWFCGDNAWGQRGDGTSQANGTSDPWFDAALPTTLFGDPWPAVRLASGTYSEMAALTEDGRLFWWGWEGGATGFPFTDVPVEHTLPTIVPASDVVKLRNVSGALLIVDSLGRVWHKGWNFGGTRGFSEDYTLPDPSPLTHDSIHYYAEWGLVPDVGNVVDIGATYSAVYAACLAAV